MIVRRAYGSLLGDDDGSNRYHISITFGNLVGFLTYSSDFDYWPGHVGRLPTGLPPSSFGVKWGKGDGHQFLPALVTKLMDGTFICCSWFIQNWLCPKTFDPPSPHKNVQSYSDNPFVKLSKNVVIFLLHFPLKKLPHLILDKFQKNQFFSLMFLYPLLQLQKSVSSTLRKAESIWGTRGKKTIRKSPRSVNLYFSKDWNTISSMKYEFAQVPTVAVDQN